MTKRVASSASAALWQHYRDTGDPETRAELLAQYVGLVHHTVRHIAARVGDAVEYDDLVGAGHLGLVRAFEAFDATRGTAFTTYATQRIRGSVLDELRAADWRPRTAREEARAVQQTTEMLTQREGRTPTATEIAAELGVDMETFYKWYGQTKSATAVSLHEPGVDRGRGAAPSPAELIADPAVVPADVHMVRDEAREGLRDAILTLPEQQRVVLALCYDEELNLRQIAQVLHVTESRVSQIRTAAIKNLRARLAMEKN